ncbi:MAG: tRNA (cytidine(34)-2'-O)-methyltransferase [Pseudomonadota bacterium]
MPTSKVRLALYQPDIPQNTGTLMRLAACLDIPLEIIAPAGFDLSDKALMRAGMDYTARARLVRHRDFEAFEATLGGANRLADDHDLNERARLVLLTAAAADPFHMFQFRIGDVLLAGRESSGVPDDIHERADARVCIPMAPDCRSLNVAVASAMVVSEALRQLDGFPSRT